MENENFIKMICHINKKPGMYAVNRVEDISLIVFGYQSGFWANQSADSLTNLMVDFRAFVNKQYKRKDDYDWPRLIRFHSGSDSHSREIFADLFVRFIKAKGYKDE